MIGSTDYTGLATLISAVGAVVTGLVVALRQTRTSKKIEEVHNAVRTENGQTIGELVEAGEVRRVEGTK